MRPWRCKLCPAFRNHGGKDGYECDLDGPLDGPQPECILIDDVWVDWAEACRAREKYDPEFARRVAAR